MSGQAQIAKEAIKRDKKYRPPTGTVHNIDGDRVDLRILNAPGIIRHVEVIGSADKLRVGDIVTLQWRENDSRPVVLQYDSYQGGD
jgi:hypothetical protein